MSKDELKQLLKENLTISVHTYEKDDGCSYTEVRVSFDNEEICSSCDDGVFVRNNPEDE